MCTSVPQTPARRTRIRTSLSRIEGRSTSRSSKPGSEAAFTNALTDSALDAGNSGARRASPSSLVETSPVRTSEGSADCVRTTRRSTCAATHTHARREYASPFAIRDSLLRAFSHAPIFAQVDRYSRGLDRDARVVNERHGRRGYCVGSPRTGLLTSTSSLAAASASRAVAPFASTTRLTAPRSPVRGEFLFHRRIARIARAPRAAQAVLALLLARQGRHALDEVGGSARRRSTSRCDADFAVKKLRIVGSAVLLLNFREVRALHFCSTGVTM